MIGLAQKKLNLSVHETLKYLEAMIGQEIETGRKTLDKSLNLSRDYEKDFEQMQGSFIASPIAREYAGQRCL